MEKMCNVLGVSKSGYFKWVKRPKSERKKKHEKLSQEILKTHLEFKQRYGSIKIAKTLNKCGLKINERTVSRIMTTFILNHFTEYLNENWLFIKLGRKQNKRLENRYLNTLSFFTTQRKSIRL